MERLKTMPIEELIPLILEKLDEPMKAERYLVQEVPVHLTSLRLRTFAVKGITCISCNLKASFFAFERSFADARKDGAYHLCLYGVKSDGKEVLFTKDHIVAKSDGGKDQLGNMQTMCTCCNGLKGNKSNKTFMATRVGPVKH